MLSKTTSKVQQFKKLLYIFEIQSTFVFRQRTPNTCAKDIGVAATEAVANSDSGSCCRERVARDRLVFNGGIGHAFGICEVSLNQAIRKLSERLVKIGKAFMARSNCSFCKDGTVAPFADPWLCSYIV